MSFAEPTYMPKANGEMAQYGSDAALHVEFEMRPVFMEALSKKEGKEIWEDRAFVTIAQPGAKSDIVRQVKMEGTPNHPSDPERFPRQWAAFQAKHEQVQTGLPLEQCAFMSKARVLEFKSQRIHTCEQLAELPDSVCQTLGLGARELRDQARARLDENERARALSVAHAETDDLRNEVETLRRQLEQLASAQRGVTAEPAPIHEMETAIIEDKPRRGRPPLNRENAS